MEITNLPDELLSSIVSHVEDPSYLNHLSCVSSRVNSLAEPYLYRSVVIYHGSQALLLARAISARTFRASYVRRLLVSVRFDDSAGVEAVPSLIGKLTNLQVLDLETPDCNQKLPEERLSWIRLQERYERIFELSSLLVTTPFDRCLSRLLSCRFCFLVLKLRCPPALRFCALVQIISRSTAFPRSDRFCFCPGHISIHNTPLL